MIRKSSIRKVSGKEKGISLKITSFLVLSFPTISTVSTGIETSGYSCAKKNEGNNNKM
jgi:hypothetical protein